MSLILLNLQSNQLIKLDNDNPLVIGRGNVEGCFDKRVSRNHGRITCTLDGKLRLEALHCNPCFFTRNGIPPIQQLNKNEEETLKEGDYLGLLPNAFWFKITTENKAKVKNEPELSNNIKTEVSYDENARTDAEITNGASQAEELQNDKISAPSVVQNKSNLNSTPASTSNPENSTKVFGTPEFEKTRRLPLWMYEINETVTSNENSYKCSSLSKSPAKPSSMSGTDTSRKKLKMLTEDEIKKESTAGTENKACNNTIYLPSTSKVETKVESLDSQSGSANKEPNQECPIKEGYESNINIEEGTSARPICQYEGRCYRKNPQHRTEFSHPGDSDYKPQEERPICQFGAACYRRNERHRVEFRHPPCGAGSQNLSPSSSSQGSIASSPLPAKRRRKKVKRGNSDYEDEDEYDVEDPFLNDASSDEYIPTDLESEEQETEDLNTSREDD